MDLLDEFQTEVARIALQAAERHGFALAGGNALAVHGVIVRPTEDIDLFTMTRLQLVRFERHRAPVMMDIGPVLHLDDILGSKVAALATRAEPRDYIDVAAALQNQSSAHLLDLARQADPDLTDAEFADAMQRLDRLDDAVFTQLYGLTPGQVSDIRTAFSAWPR